MLGCLVPSRSGIDYRRGVKQKGKGKSAAV